MRGAEQILARAEPRHLVAAPEDRDRQARLGAQREMVAAVGDQSGGALLIFAGEPPLGGGEQHLAVGMARGRIDLEGEAAQAPDRIGADADLALGVDQHRELARALAAEIAHQHGGAPVDEALGEPLVERVGELLLDRHRPVRHRLGLGQPVGAVGDIGPGAHPGDPVGERVDVALDVVEPGELLGIPALRDMAFGQIGEEPGHQPGMMVGAGLAEIGQAADRPEPLDQRRASWPAR